MAIFLWHDHFWGAILVQALQDSFHQWLRRTAFCAKKPFKDCGSLQRLIKRNNPDMFHPPSNGKLLYAF